MTFQLNVAACGAAGILTSLLFLAITIAGLQAEVAPERIAQSQVVAQRA